MEMHSESLVPQRVCFVSYPEAHRLCGISFKEIPAQHIIILKKQLSLDFNLEKMPEKDYLQSTVPNFQSPVPFPSLSLTPVQGLVLTLLLQL